MENPTPSICVILLLDFLISLCPLYAPKYITGKNEKIDWFNPAIGVMVGSWTWILSCISLIAKDYSGLWVTSASYAPVLLELVILSLISKTFYFTAFYYTRYRESDVDIKLTQHNTQHILLSGKVLMIIGIIGYLFIIWSAGSVQTLIANVALRRTTFSGKAHLTLLTLALPVGLYAYTAVKLIVKRVSVIEVVMILLTFMLFLTLGGRSAAAKVVICVLMLSNYLYIRIPGRVIVPVAVIGYILLLSLGEIRSEAAYNGGFELRMLFNTDIYGSVLDLSRNSESTQGLERTLLVYNGVPSDINYQWGTSYSSLITTWIPRSLYPEKPGLSEAAIYSPLFGHYTDGKIGMFPAGSLGDFWLQAGILGIVVGFTLQGLLSGYLYQQLLKTNNILAIISICVCFLYGFTNLRNLGIFQSIMYLLWIGVMHLTIITLKK